MEKFVKIDGSELRVYLEEEDIPRGAVPLDGVIDVEWAADEGDPRADRFGRRRALIPLPGFVRHVRTADCGTCKVVWVEKHAFLRWIQNHPGAWPWVLLGPHRANPRELPFRYPSRPAASGEALAASEEVSS